MRTRHGCEDFWQRCRGSATERIWRSRSRFPWAKYKTFADLGAAQGDLAVQIALANPHLKGIGFDLAGVRSHLRGVCRGEQGKRSRAISAGQLLHGFHPSRWM